MKKTAAVILVFIMLATFVGCKGRGENEAQTDISQNETQQSTDEVTKPSSNAKANFVLPYSENDTLNPYKAKSQINRTITTLLYDSLYTLDEKFMPQAIIADEADIKKDSVTVTIKRDVSFSDDTQLSASDVVYSFDKAKESKRYGELLNGISAAVATERYTVRFVLSRADMYACNVLTFPIIKYGSIEQKVPTGSGRYVYSSGKLSYNKEHISGKTPKIKTIGLCSLSEKSSSVDALQVGNISFLFRDLSDCDIQRAVARTVPININNLIYIGINSENELLKDNVLRRAINTAIDKEDIVSRDFHGYAVRTETPFDPVWGQTTQKESIFNQAQAVEMLEKAGYTYASQNNKYRRSKEGKELSFKIVVCEDNEFRLDAANSIAKNLSQVGINAQISKMSFSKYKEAVKEKKFDLYVGEIKLCENMSLSPFFSKDGKARYGIDEKSGIIKSYEALIEDEKSVTAFESEFSQILPFIPVCYRQGIVMATNTLSENTNSISVDMFYNIYEWQMN